ncbi:MAG: hypothetical protein HY323_14940 [Betaproteobacteria bacterium]|nr:hypothetical protein [Betaproteobacteria bacterium]
MAAANNVRLTANTRNLDLRATTGNALLKAGGSMHAEVGAVSGAEAAGDEKGKYTLTVENDITIKTEKGEITIEASQKGCTIKVAGDLKLEVNGKMETRTWGAGAEFHGGAKLDSYLGSMTDIKMANENKIFAGLLKSEVNLGGILELAAVLKTEFCFGPKYTFHELHAHDKTVEFDNAVASIKNIPTRITNYIGDLVVGDLSAAFNDMNIYM